MLSAQREVCPIIPSRLGLTQFKQLNSQFQLYLKFRIIINVQVRLTVYSYMLHVSK